MGYEHGKGADKRVSLVQGDEFFHKVISRDSTVGCSSRVYYYRSSHEGVPFEWEMQPGTPKEPPKDEEIPPITPPPAVLSLGLPLPCINNEQPKAKAWLLRLSFWNKIKKNKESKSVKEFGSRGSSHETHDYGTEKFEFCGSDCEFMESSSSPRASSSSSSPSLSLSNGPSVQSSRLESTEGKANSFHDTLSCNPWSISTILVSIARRV